MDKLTDAELSDISRELRKKTIHSLYKAQSGHPGSSLSAIELLAVLFFDEMDLEGPHRSRFVLSKGHAVPALYAAFAELGWIEGSELDTLRQIGSRLQGHPDIAHLPLLDAGTGALGQGASIAIGYALAARLRGTFERVFCIIGDGESQEGQIWEAAMYASAREIDNLVFILDCNKFQNEESVRDTLPIAPLKQKWESFGWNVIEVDGHDIQQIRDAFESARSTKGRPTMVIADTVKGKGISFMEDNAAWHSRNMQHEEYEQALACLSSDPIS